MNIVSDPKAAPASSILSPEANQAAALTTATGVLTVDLDAIVANWRKLEKTAVPAECAGVIKADAYGCGVDPVARALASAGCKAFFVATLDEARAARAAVPAAAIYVLDGFFQNTGDAYAKIDARPVIGDLNELAEWDVFCRRTGWAGGAAIHIDTGLNRLGLTVTEAQGIVPRIVAVGYGGTWTARRPTKLAIVSSGYADGYFRAGSSNDGTRGAEVVVAGKRCPIAGRVSMDLIAVDITDLEKNAARRGHMATLIGEGITVDELAHHFGTIGYEVLTSLGPRYTRVHKGGAAAEAAAEPAAAATSPATAAS